MAPHDTQTATIVYIKADDLKEFDGNPMRRTDKTLQHLEKSLLEFGFVDPVIVWRNAEEFGYPANTVIGGHRRLDAYRSLIAGGRIEDLPVPCVPVTLKSAEQAKGLNVALNRIGETFDYARLSAWLAEITIDTEALGFDQLQWDGILDYKPDKNYAERAAAAIDEKLPAGDTVCPKCGYAW